MSTLSGIPELEAAQALMVLRGSRHEHSDKSTITTAGKRELEAAQALLELHERYRDDKCRIAFSSENDEEDFVLIGAGHALVPSRIFKNIDWSSYTYATRKLLTAVFSRKVLATHSLSGKPSPAFPDKPAKQKLDAALVNDIVQTVAEKCHVSEKVVRTCVTVKCADEAKMYRTRRQNKMKDKSVGKENISPSDSDDTD